MDIEDTFKKNDIKHKLAIRMMIANIFKMLLVTVVCGIFALILSTIMVLFVNPVGGVVPPGGIVIFVFLIFDALIFVILIITYIVRTIHYMNGVNC
jgi:hypothetical protein